DLRARVRGHDGALHGVPPLLQRVRSEAGPELPVRRGRAAVRDRAPERPAPCRLRRRTPEPRLHLHRQRRRREPGRLHRRARRRRGDEHRLRRPLHAAPAPRRDRAAPRRHARSRVPARAPGGCEAFPGIDRARPAADRLQAGRGLRRGPRPDRRVLPAGRLMAPPTTAVASVTIAEAPLDGAGWTDYSTAHPAATFFHQPGWLEVVRRTFGYRHASILARRDGRVVGFLPLFLVPTLPWGRSLISTPQAVYGGPIADDDEARSALVDHAARFAEGRGASFLELRNETPIPGLAGKDLYVTFRRPILPDAEQNMAAIPRNQRRSIRVAQKHGLKARVGGGDLLDGFYHVYSESVRNLGTPVFPRALFANALERFGEDAFILGVEKGDQLLS